MIKRTTVRLPAELLKKAQRKAAAEGRTLTGLMEEGLRYMISEKPTIDQRARIMPPISKEGGGQAPDVKTLKDLEEIEDADYIERLRNGFK